MQRSLAGAAGAEERRLRSVLDFLGRGRALLVASAELDRRLTWEIFGAIEVEDRHIPLRRVPSTLAGTADPQRRHAIEQIQLEALDGQHHIISDFLVRQREGIDELGYGSHVETHQILGSIDLQAMARDATRFLEESADAYRDLLGWYAPRSLGVPTSELRLADAARMLAAPEYDGLFGSAPGRTVTTALAGCGIDPFAEGRLHVDWEARVAGASGAAAAAPDVPGMVRLAVGSQGGRAALSSFLFAYGWALHHACTDPELPVEERRLGDESVPLASAGLLESLLRTPSFLRRVFGFPRVQLDDYLRHAQLCHLYATRLEAARLTYEIAYYESGASEADFADLLREATGFQHDPRGALWSIDFELGTARRIRGIQLAAVHAMRLRNRFDEDWFRNPSAGGYLIDLFSHGRRYSAPEMAVQLGEQRLGYDG